MRFAALVRQFVLRPLRRDKLRSGLTILSVALGVAVVIAVDLASDAATGSFQSSMTSLVGKVDYEVTANGGVDERLMAPLTALPVNAQFAAVIEQPVTVSQKGSVTLFGVESLVDPAVAVVSSDAAERFAWKTGSTIELRGRDRSAHFQVQKIVAEQSVGWVAVDIAAAQQLLDSYGRIDRIEVTVDTGEDAASVERMVRATVPSTYDVSTQRREPAHAAGVPLESADIELHLAAGGCIPHLQHDRGERGAATGGDRHFAGPGRECARRAGDISGRSRDARSDRIARWNRPRARAGKRHGRHDFRYREFDFHHERAGCGDDFVDVCGDGDWHGHRSRGHLRADSGARSRESRAC